MNYILLKPIISASSWMLLWYGFLAKPLNKLTKKWNIAHYVLLVIIISFTWGWLVGEAVDMVRSFI